MHTVIGIDTDECLICQDLETGDIYNCGETLLEYGIDNLTKEEARLCKTPKPAS